MAQPIVSNRNAAVILNNSNEPVGYDVDTNRVFFGPVGSRTGAQKLHEDYLGLRREVAVILP